MNSFNDPRISPHPNKASGHAARPTADLQALSELHRLCNEGRLYEVEQWIQDGRPLQASPEADRGRHRSSTALEIALEKGNHALTLLLLCNGYDPNLEEYSPLDLALQARRWDLLDLLLEWRTDPNEVELEDLFGTYNSQLFGRFMAMGVDLTAGHALADALAHTSNKPLFGFVRRHRQDHKKFQAELNSALAHHAAKGNEKGVHLSLWAGADPHAPARSLRYGRTNEEDEDDIVGGWTAVREACSNGHLEILRILGPDPGLDNYDDLYRAAENIGIIEELAKSALPQDMTGIISWHLSWLGFGFHAEWRAVHTLERLFEVGGRWNETSNDAIAGIRRQLLKLSDRVFIDVMKLFATKEYCAPHVLRELGRTPSIRKRMKEVRFIPPDPEDSTRYDRDRPTRSRDVLSKFGVELPKPPKGEPPLPHTVRIGSYRPDGQEIRMNRAELFERVWSEPVSKIAARWGLSGPGLGKACRRLQIPLPPRGYWAKLKAGRKLRRPKLRSLPQGQAEQILIDVRSEGRIREP